MTNPLQKIQEQLKAPKGQENKFGGYKYRSAADILAAVKPLLGAESLSLTLSDEIVEVGGRVYVKATAALHNKSHGLEAQVTAFAREPLARKGMDESQITGAASSYARKYAMAGLFAIDDEADADTMDNRDQGRQAKEIRDAMGDILAEAESLEALREIWGDCTPAERHAFEQVKNNRKKELEGSA